MKDEPLMQIAKLLNKKAVRTKCTESNDGSFLDNNDNNYIIFTHITNEAILFNYYKDGEFDYDSSFDLITESDFIDGNWKEYTKSEKEIELNIKLTEKELETLSILMRFDRTIPKLLRLEKKITSEEKVLIENIMVKLFNNTYELLEN